jgi:hypothetical protein
MQNQICIYCDKEDKEVMAELALELGCSNLRNLIKLLARAHKDGVLAIMNKVAKECLVGSAEERIIKMAKRAALEETNFTLWQKGFITDPYDR